MPNKRRPTTITFIAMLGIIVLSAATRLYGHVFQTFDWQHTAQAPQVRHVASSSTRGSPTISAPTDLQLTNSGTKSSLTPEQSWNIADFRFTFADDIAGSFPQELPVYRLGFIMDATGMKKEVDEADATALANQLSIAGPVHEAYDAADTNHQYPQWFSGSGSPDEIYSFSREQTSTRPAGAAVEINPNDGSFVYGIHATCGDNAVISPEQALDAVRGFITEHHLDLGETTSTVGRPLGDRGCYYVDVLNSVPIDSVSLANDFLLRDERLGPGDLESPLDGNYLDSHRLSVHVDPETGNIVSVESNYLRLNEIGIYQIRTMDDLKADATILSDASIPREHQSSV